MKLHTPTQGFECTERRQHQSCSRTLPFSRKNGPSASSSDHQPTTSLQNHFNCSGELHSGPLFCCRRCSAFEKGFCFCSSCLVNVCFWTCKEPVFMEKTKLCFQDFAGLKWVITAVAEVRCQAERITLITLCECRKMQDSNVCQRVWIWHTYLILYFPIWNPLRFELQGIVIIPIPIIPLNFPPYLSQLAISDISEAHSSLFLLPRKPLLISCSLLISPWRHLNFSSNPWNLCVCNMEQCWSWRRAQNSVWVVLSRTEILWKREDGSGSLLWTEGEIRGWGRGEIGTQHIF